MVAHGTTKTGEQVRVRGVDLLEFRGDKIVKKDSYWKIVDDVVANERALPGQHNRLGTGGAVGLP